MTLAVSPTTPISIPVSVPRAHAPVTQKHHSESAPHRKRCVGWTGKGCGMKGSCYSCFPVLPAYSSCKQGHTRQSQLATTVGSSSGSGAVTPLKRSHDTLGCHDILGENHCLSHSATTACAHLYHQENDTIETHRKVKWFITVRRDWIQVVSLWK